MVSGEVEPVSSALFARTCECLVVSCGQVKVEAVNTAIYHSETSSGQLVNCGQLRDGHSEFKLWSIAVVISDMFIIPTETVSVQWSEFCWSVVSGEVEPVSSALFVRTCECLVVSWSVVRYVYHFV